MLLRNTLGSACMLFAFVVNAQSVDQENTEKFVKENSATGTKTRRASIDPDTGKLTSEAPDPGTEKRAEGDPLPESEISATVDKAGPLQIKKDGSMMVELNGQFDKPLRATIGDDGKLYIQHDEAVDSDHQEGNTK